MISLERQDDFVLNILAKHQTGGIFLDVGCGNPVAANNTYVLEKSFGWNGFAFDIGNVEEDEEWGVFRDTPFHQVDVSTPEFTQLLIELIPTKTVDYISLDVDMVTFDEVKEQMYDLTFIEAAIFRILEAGITFKAMTVEHEEFKRGNELSNLIRGVLRERGYETLFENVCFEDGNAFEDWWIKPDLVPLKNILDIQNNNLTFNQCIQSITEFNKLV